MTCDEVVEQVGRTIRDVGERVRAEFRPLTPEQLRWQPSPERWGVGHCLVHLREVGQQAFPGFEDALDRARKKGLDRPDAPYRPGWVGRRMVDAMAPGAGMKVKTPGRFSPRAVPRTVVSDYTEYLERYQRLLDRARGLDLSAFRAPSPASPLIRLRLADLLLLMANHERRHLHQALAVVADPGFPRASAAASSP